MVKVAPMQVDKDFLLHTDKFLRKIWQNMEIEEASERIVSNISTGVMFLFEEDYAIFAVMNNSRKNKSLKLKGAMKNLKPFQWNYWTLKNSMKKEREIGSNREKSKERRPKRLYTNHKGNRSSRVLYLKQRNGKVRIISSSSKKNETYIKNKS